jgi:hypothetical protein
MKIHAPCEGGKSGSELYRMHFLLLAKIGFTKVGEITLPRFMAATKSKVCAKGKNRSAKW